MNQQSNVYVTKQGQLGKMDGYHNLNWKPLKVEDELQGEFGEDDPTEVETVENEDTAENEDESVAEEIVNVKEVNNNVTDSVDDTRHTLNDEHRKTVERLNE